MANKFNGMSVEDTFNELWKNVEATNRKGGSILVDGIDWNKYLKPLRIKGQDSEVLFNFCRYVNGRTFTGGDLSLVSITDRRINRGTKCVTSANSYAMVSPKDLNNRDCIQLTDKSLNSQVDLAMENLFEFNNEEAKETMATSGYENEARVVFSQGYNTDNVFMKYNLT